MNREQAKIYLRSSGFSEEQINTIEQALKKEPCTDAISRQVALRQIVIEIPKELYKAYKGRPPMLGDAGMDMIAQAIATGIPLPKGHGRLKDIDKIEWYGCTTAFDCPHKDRECKDCNKAECSKTQVDDIPTIIEADKQYEAKVITRGKCMMCGKELTEGLFFCKECEDKASNVRKLAESEEKLSWLGKNCKDCGNEKCKKLGTLPKGYDCALWQAESEE